MHGVRASGSPALYFAPIKRPIQLIIVPFAYAAEKIILQPLPRGLRRAGARSRVHIFIRPCPITRALPDGPGAGTKWDNLCCGPQKKQKKLPPVPPSDPGRDVGGMLYIMELFRNPARLVGSFLVHNFVDTIQSFPPYAFPFLPVTR